MTLQKLYGIKLWRQYQAMQQFASMIIAREIVYERLPRLRDWSGKTNHIRKCVDCGRSADSYDHRDYFKPLQAEPVCNGCNRRRGSAILTLKKLKRGLKFKDPRNLYEPYPKTIQQIMAQGCRKCGWSWKLRVINPVKCPNAKCQAWMPLKKQVEAK